MMTPVILQTLAPRALSVYVEAWMLGEPPLGPFGVLGSASRWHHFLAQILHESSGFSRTHENLSYRAERMLVVWPSRFKTLEDAQPFERRPDALAEKVYGGRIDLGNTQPGDGWKYRGRGAIQLTGRANYARIGQHLGLDLVDHPDLVVQPPHILRASAVFWQLAGCNQAADRDDVRLVTKRINGGETGLADRRAWLALVRTVYGVSPIREA